MTEITKIPIFVRDFSFSVKTKKGSKTILDHINLSIPSGSLVAIIGASGAGKTTLLNSIAGRLSGKSEGSILFGNEPYSSNINKILSYVTQQDTMHTNLTPRQILKFGADLRLPKRIKDEEKNQIVGNILKSLQIEHCADIVVGSPETGIKRGISGGEMKRVNIGMGLVTNPSVILVDEPTSGLDAQTAYLCTSILKDLTKEGRTIISTIHQPRQSIFELFDYLVLLSHGKLVYFGPINEIENYFSNINFFPPRNTNLADWLIDLVSLPEEELQKEETINKLSKALSIYQKDEIQLDIIHQDYPDKDEKDELELENPMNQIQINQPESDLTKNTQTIKFSVDDNNENDENKINEMSNGKMNQNEKQNPNNDDDLDTEDIPNDFEEITVNKLKSTDPIKNNSNGVVKGEVGTLEFIKSLVSHFNKSDLMKAALSMEIPKEKLNLHLEPTANPFKKTWILTKRGFYGVRNQKNYLVQRVLQPTLLACLVGWIFTGVSDKQSGLNDRMGILFFAIMSQMMLSMNVVLFELAKEKAIFLRESMDSAYSTFSFFISKVLIELPFSVIVPTIFTIIISAIAGLQMNPKPLFTLVGFCILQSFAGSGFGFMISAAVRLPEIALSIAPILLVPMTMFCGFMINLNNITKALSWIQYIDPLKYSFLAAVKNEYTGLTFTCSQSELVEGICPITSGEQYLKQKGYYNVNYWENAGILLAFVGICWILSIYFLSRTRKKETGR
eukprot:Anaeramoba_ignava/a347346_273.p1 GENE.a347346_273~~a347346_273.p1  ORF type:complete len:732 (+),score=261.06 a347346_273:31-2226(+)